MCEFVSWVEANNKVYFLTKHLIDETPKGEIMKRRFPGEGDLLGYAAIRGFYDER